VSSVPGPFEVLAGSQQRSASRLSSCASLRPAAKEPRQALGACSLAPLGHGSFAYADLAQRIEDPPSGSPPEAVVGEARPPCTASGQVSSRGEDLTDGGSRLKQNLEQAILLSSPSCGTVGHGRLP
jgi:hypothetical protein